MKVGKGNKWETSVIESMIKKTKTKTKKSFIPIWIVTGNAMKQRNINTKPERMNTLNFHKLSRKSLSCLGRIGNRELKENNTRGICAEAVLILWWSTHYCSPQSLFYRAGAETQQILEVVPKLMS